MNKGDMVQLRENNREAGFPSVGTVVKVTKFKVLVLFPIRRFVWLEKQQVNRIPDYPPTK